MLDVGMSYLGQLVQRCMVQVQLTRFNKRIKRCCLHDLMRDLRLLKAKEENFLEIVHIKAFGHQLTGRPNANIGEVAPLKESLLLERRWFVLLHQQHHPAAAEVFPQLKSLMLESIQNLEEWKVEQKAMPCLFRLVIVDCPKLKEIPNGLRFIATLRELQIQRVSEALRDRLREGGDDFYKVHHMPSIVIP
ncbi:putative disease resistance protein RDL5 [Camellia lanceoleosa]|uniref:Disease resistance protein RDL5 n=1 Tax=Camellia lanceoleosa TaxID=1840588 RepID=A0ACC0IRM1_9ERIC|nr:putative disease resistance protein RDL5 [Camellia lanceoleosa]